MASAGEGPTEYPEVNRVIDAVLAGAREVLGSRLVGFYLDGSLVSGGFDRASDIDFAAVVEDELSEADFLALREMHERVARMDSEWAIQVEGSYLSRRAIRRYDPRFSNYPNIERGRGERLKMVEHGAWWAIHRWVLRERGTALFGPPARDLIEPVLPEELRGAVEEVLRGWARGLLESPQQIRSQGYQSYIVLSICRILYTLTTGGVASKPAAVDWALEHLDARWAPVIQHAWLDRFHPDGPPDPAKLAETLAFIRFALDRETPSS